MDSLRARIRLTIGTKLVGLIAILLVVSVFSLVWLSTRMFVEDTTDFVNNTNIDTATSAAGQMHDLFDDLTDRMRVLGTVLMQNVSEPGVKDRIIHEFFAKDKNFLAVYVLNHQDNGTVIVTQMALSPEMSNLGDSEGLKTYTALTQEKDFSLPQVSQGEVQLTAFKLLDGKTTALAVAVPFIQAVPPPTAIPGTPWKDHFSHTLIGLINQSKLATIFSQRGVGVTFMVDRKGKILVHSEAGHVDENVSHLQIVKRLLEGKVSNDQLRYDDPVSKEPKLGAFRMVGFGGLGVVSEVQYSKAVEVANQVKHRSVLIGLIILSLSFLAGYFFSGTISYPIKQLVVAAKRIASGDFKIDLHPKGRDEVATLSLAFNDMAKGLEERDRVKDTFNKFHNKEIAEKLLSGEVKLGGERKEATIFFSDVRGFTAMSESMEPEQVVEMLNEYMTRMVAIIRAHHGIVDKYVGDAIMALWGVPIGGPNDTYNALKACIAMREDLAKLNELRISRGQTALKIGMGLNCGQVIAGNIGSVEKMEYTVIGDTVNTASRMESMTKEYGTDLLIPRAIHDNVKGKFVFEQAKSAKVKGKTSALEVFKVKGYINDQGQTVMVETAYSSYASEKSDKAVHDDPPSAVHSEVPTQENTVTQLMSQPILVKSLPAESPAHEETVQLVVELEKTEFITTKPEVIEFKPVAAPILETTNTNIVMPTLETKSAAPVAAPPPFKKSLIQRKAA